LEKLGWYAFSNPIQLVYTAETVGVTVANDVKICNNLSFVEIGGLKIWLIMAYKLWEIGADMQKPNMNNPMVFDVKM